MRLRRGVGTLAFTAVLLCTGGCIPPGEGSAPEQDESQASASPESPGPVSSQAPTSALPDLSEALPPPQDTLFGASFQRRGKEDYPQALARTDRALGLEVVRVFYPGLPEPWPGVAPDRDLVVSFKIDPLEVRSGLHDATMQEWFRTAPTDRRVYWVYWHEPENDSEAGLFEPEDFRLAYAHLAELAQAVGNPDLHATVVLMSYSLSPESGRDWLDWFPPTDSVDVLAWDVYNRGTGSAFYPPPDELLGPVEEASRSVGKPFAIAELASPRAPGDRGPERAAWMTQVGCYLLETDAHFATWFDFLWNDGKDDYRLRDRPSQRAWHELADLEPGDPRCDEG